MPPKHDKKRKRSDKTKSDTVGLEQKQPTDGIANSTPITSAHESDSKATHQHTTADFSEKQESDALLDDEDEGEGEELGDEGLTREAQEKIVSIHDSGTVLDQNFSTENGSTHRPRSSSVVLETAHGGANDSAGPLLTVSGQNDVEHTVSEDAETVTGKRATSTPPLQTTEEERSLQERFIDLTERYDSLMRIHEQSLTTLKSARRENVELTTVLQEKQSIEQRLSEEYKLLAAGYAELQNQLECIQPTLDIESKSENDALIERVRNLSAIQYIMEQDLTSKGSQITELKRHISSLEGQLQLMQEAAAEKTEHKPSDTETLPAAIKSNALLRVRRASDAIAQLEREIVAESKSDRDNALRAIVALLKNGLASDDAQSYFEQNKESLRKEIQALNDWKALANKAVNVVLTVLAFASVVGIGAAWLSGNLEKNAKLHGSQFAFVMFADKQKSQRAIHEVNEALSCKAVL